MITAAAYYKNCQENEIRKAGFDGMEIRYPEDLDEDCLEKTDAAAAGIRFWTGMLLEEGGKEKLSEVIRYAGKRNVPVIVAETFGVSRGEQVISLFKHCVKEIKEAAVPVCLENGCFFSDGRWHRNGLSNGRDLKEAVDQLNQEAGYPIFGGSVHVGCANLLSLNIGEIIHCLGNQLRSVCLQDNDGREDFGQLPYTFTSGRGALTTPWPSTLRSLADVSFDGLLTIRLPGLFSNLPKPLVPVMLDLAKGVADEWKEQIEFEKWLDQGKKRILFGCGIRFENYMKVWGNRYPPDLIADNNRKLWGTRNRNTLIVPPEEILKIPEEERIVLICNQYYIEIGKQLQDMGIAYRVYSDGYWGRYQKIEERRSR